VQFNKNFKSQNVRWQLKERLEEN